MWKEIIREGVTKYSEDSWTSRLVSWFCPNLNEKGELRWIAPYTPPCSNAETESGFCTLILPAPYTATPHFPDTLALV